MILMSVSVTSPAFLALWYVGVAMASEDTVILVTDLASSKSTGNIYSINVTSRQVQVLPLFKVLSPVAISYDDVTDMIYWSDKGSKEIRTSELSGERERTFIDLNTGSQPDGMTLDSINRMIFYADTGNKVIASVSMKWHNSSKTIISTDIDKPRGVVTHAAKRWLFWSDWGMWPKIERCNYDGTDRKELVTRKINWPNGIALDETRDMLYWTDGLRDTVESIRLDGTGRTRILHEEGIQFYGLVLFDHILYVTNWTRNPKTVRLIHLNGSELSMISSDKFTKLKGITVLKASRCTAGTYGPHCNSTCGKCMTGTCNKKTGMCVGGCKPGWYGNQADAHCSLPCGHCAGDAVCDDHAGHCPRGCVAGWTGLVCGTAKTTNTTSTKSSATTNIAATTQTSATTKLPSTTNIVSTTKMTTQHGGSDTVNSSVQVPVLATSLEEPSSPEAVLVLTLLSVLVVCLAITTGMLLFLHMKQQHRTPNSMILMQDRLSKIFGCRHFAQTNTTNVSCQTTSTTTLSSTLSSPTSISDRSLWL